MREIKFRGKRFDNGEWVYGYYVVAAGMPFISRFGIREPILIKPETAGQFVGLYDKKGDDIYEGDILRCRLYDGKYENYMVEFENHRDRYGNNAEYVAYNKDRTNFMSSSIWHKFEIVGNISDNPELIEV